MYKTYKLFIFLFAMFIQSTTLSQSIKKISFKKITVDENLSSAYVRKSVQDKNGFIWIATQDGLNKYDGNSIIQFTKHSTNLQRQILGSDCFDMNYKMGDSLLYVINSYDGLNCIDINTNCVSKKISNSDLSKSKSEEWLKSMTRINNSLFIATNNKIITLNTVDNKTTKTLDLNLEKGNTITEIFIYKNYVAAILTSGEIMFYNFNLSFKFKQQIKTNKALRNVNKYFLKNNYLWLTFNEGLQIHDLENPLLDKTSEYLKGIPEFIFKLQTSGISIQNEDLYFANTLGCFVYNFKSNEFKLLQNTTDESLKDFLNGAFHFLFTNNNLFVSGITGVAEIKTNQMPFSAFYKDEVNKTKIENCYAIKKIKNLILTATENAFYSTDMNTGNIKMLLPNTFVYSFCEIEPNKILVSSTNRLSVLVNGKELASTEIYPELEPIKKDLFIGIEKINDSIIFLASESGTGLYKWNIKNHLLINYNAKSIPAFSNNLINNFYYEGHSKLLIVGELFIEEFDIIKNTIQILFSKDTLKKRKADVFMDICSTKNNYWVAAYGLGIIKLGKDFKIQKIIGIDEGLNNVGCYKIFQSSDSLITLTTNNGLSVYNIIQDKVSNFFKKDGLNGNVFNELSGYKEGDSIYIGGLKGFTVFTTKNYNTNKRAPLLYWSNINVDAVNKSIDTTNLFFKEFDITTNYSRVRINFSSINFNNPTRVNYWYRIKELGNNWIDIKNQNFIDLIGISPGKYTLEVKAANEDGVECEPISLKLHFLPKWYQTLLFKILLGLLISTLLYILYRFRVKQLEKIIVVRQKISQNLHDDIGSTLSAINMYTQVAKLQPQQNDFLNSIESNTHDVLDKLDDIIWSTNPKNDKFSNLLNRMETFAYPLCKANGVLFKLENSNDLDQVKISETIRQNVFLIFKEAINNALKYANCNQINTILSIKNKTLICTITDNGKGFDTALHTERNGLLNMQLRAKELKGNCVIASKFTEGATVTIQIPL